MSTFLAMLRQCRLEEAEAAEYLGVSTAQIRQWGDVSGLVPDEALRMLGDLDRRIDEAASIALTTLIDLGITDDDVQNLTMENLNDRMPEGSARAAGARRCSTTLERV